MTPSALSIYFPPLNWATHSPAQLPHRSRQTGKGCSPFAEADSPHNRCSPTPAPSCYPEALPCLISLWKMTADGLSWEMLLAPAVTAASLLTACLSQLEANLPPVRQRFILPLQPTLYWLPLKNKRLPFLSCLLLLALTIILWKLVVATTDDH